RRRHEHRLRRERGGADRQRPQPARHAQLRRVRARAAREELHEDRLSCTGGPLMSAKMKIRKGDLVQMLSGKPGVKQGQVSDARRGEQRVVVENLNIVKRHTPPPPMKESSRMGGTQ